MTHIETSRELEAKREGDWEKSRKAVSPNKNTPASTEDMTGTTIGTREDQHENADRVGRGDKPETSVNPASLAAEDQTERSHSKGDTPKGQGAEVARKTVSDSIGERHKTSVPGMSRTAERKVHVKSRRIENQRAFADKK